MAKYVPKSLSKHFYASPEWRNSLARNLAIGHYNFCLCCGAGHRQAKLVADHIKPVSKYWDLRLDPNNIQVLCEQCNQGKGAWDETDWRDYGSPANRILLCEAKSRKRYCYLKHLRGVPDISKTPKPIKPGHNPMVWQANRAEQRLHKKTISNQKQQELSQITQSLRPILIEKILLRRLQPEFAAGWVAAKPEPKLRGYCNQALHQIVQLLWPEYASYKPLARLLLVCLPEALGHADEYVRNVITAHLEFVDFQKEANRLVKEKQPLLFLRVWNMRRLHLSRFRT